MIETYLSSRESLKGVILIMDIRRSPGNEELNFIDWLAGEDLACLLVLTKTDKLSKTRQKKQLAMIANTVGRHREDLLLFSAKTKPGKAAIWRAIETITLDDAHA